MRSVIICSMIFLAGCAKHNSTLESSSQSASNALGCVNMKSKVFDSMYEYLETEQSAPDVQEFKSVLSEKIDALAASQKISDREGLEYLKQEYLKIYELLIVEAKDGKNLTDLKEHVQSLIELEMQDQSNEINVQMNSKLGSQFNKVMAAAEALGVECQSFSDTNEQLVTPIISGVSTVQSRMIAGQNNVFATAYQSCQSLEIPEVSDATGNVSGISRLAQNHPDGIGGKRVVSNLKSVQATHPYIKVSGNSSAGGCFNVYGNPLIYDYGGSPAVSNNILNFFKDAGSGTSVLGVDCSAYVSAAIGAAGFRYNPGVDNKAVYTRQSSSKFISAAKSNFKCFQNISVTSSTSIMPGDIAAISGHVVMVDRVSSDPFGLRKVSTVAGCDSIGVDYFDFSISQSSPSKSGIGINKHVAKDYLKTAGTMKTLFVEFAKASCKAKFQGKTLTPSSSAWGIIRHKGTAECLAPKIQLANQSCVSQCLQ